MDRDPLADPGQDFAHVMVAQAGFESSFREVTGIAGPTTILTFRATGDELLALAHAGLPFYKPPWSPTIVGMVIDDDTDWAEVADLVTESYRVCAPQKLARLLDGPADRASCPGVITAGRRWSSSPHTWSAPGLGVRHTQGWLPAPRLAATLEVWVPVDVAPQQTSPGLGPQP